tara:strand:+ start:202 stop:594 length:393 start_codon:yes stop_codon:yes gene_type:complete
MSGGSSGSSGSDPVYQAKDERKRRERDAASLGWIISLEDEEKRPNSKIYVDPDRRSNKIKGLPITIKTDDYDLLSDEEKKAHGGIILDPTRPALKKKKKKHTKKRKSPKKRKHKKKRKSSKKRKHTKKRR